MSGWPDEGGLRRLLMVAYHFPPLAGSSGIQRTLRFVQHLPRHQWQPLVLTASPRAYERVSDDLLAEVPEGTVVEQAFALDTARHLSIAGRYAGFMARPDRWMSWRLDAVRRGMQLIRRHRPRAIWSTFPIPTAHQIAFDLHRRSGLPWVADFRDPMAQDDYPTDPKLWAAFDALEKRTVAHAARIVFTTPGAARVYRQRYPQHANRIAVVENGYDEDSFAQAEQAGTDTGPLNPGAVTLLHSGIVYPNERDPTQLMQALQTLKRRGELSAANFRLRFRAAVRDDLITSLARANGVEDLVDLLPAMPYAPALVEMRRADGLLVLQSAGCNEQIPAKAYEYLRANRPLLCLSDPVGDTASMLRNAGVRDIAPLDDAAAITETLSAFIVSIRESRAVLPTPAAVSAASREHRSAELAEILDKL